MKKEAQDGAGNPIHPGEATIPIIKELEPGLLQIIGTGFYVARYGLVLTAQHVVEPLIQIVNNQLGPSFVLHLAEKDKCHLRKVLRAHFLKEFDLAILQVNNFLDEFPEKPLMNLRAPLSLQIPEPGSEVITYAYPENKVLDFTAKENIPVIKGDYFEGRFIKIVEKDDNPSLPYPHFETTIKLKSGASGGPVFDDKGRVIGVNCRGWDFGDSISDSENLSSIVPIHYLLPLKLELVQLPPTSWEKKQIPEARNNDYVTIEDLAYFGHILFSPSLK